jgi:hypothetical protein
MAQILITNVNGELMISAHGYDYATDIEDDLLIAMDCIQPDVEKEGYLLAIPINA